MCLLRQVDCKRHIPDWRECWTALSRRHDLQDNVVEAIEYGKEAISERMTPFLTPLITKRPHIGSIWLVYGLRRGAALWSTVNAL